jgi:hypothetical protein
MGDLRAKPSKSYEKVAAGIDYCWCFPTTINSWLLQHGATCTLREAEESRTMKKAVWANMNSASIASGFILVCIKGGVIVSVNGIVPDSYEAKIDLLKEVGTREISGTQDDDDYLSTDSTDEGLMLSEDGGDAGDEFKKDDKKGKETKKDNKMKLAYRTTKNWLPSKKNWTSCDTNEASTHTRASLFC